MVDKDLKLTKEEKKAIKMQKPLSKKKK